LSAAEVIDALADDPRMVRCKYDQIVGQPLVRLAAQFKLVYSNSEGNRLVSMKGLYLNYQQVQPGQILNPEDLVDGQFVILRAGKDKHVVLALE